MGCGWVRNHYPYIKKVKQWGGGRCEMPPQILYIKGVTELFYVQHTILFILQIRKLMYGEAT